VRQWARRCGFTRAFRPLAGYEPRGTDTYRTLLATLITASSVAPIASYEPRGTDTYRTLLATLITASSAAPIASSSKEKGSILRR
jgi:hypothetical protein